MNKKVCVVTGARSEYGLLYPVMKKIQESKSLELQLVVTTMHLSEEFGLTYKQIEKDGFTIDGKVENLLLANTHSAIAKSTGLAIVLLSDICSRLNPDVVLLLGDRFETHAAATTAMLMNIPIAHIHGGEITEGAVDEQIRHSITKMAYLHFTSTLEYRDRVIQMGEAAERVFCTGAPGIDNIVNMSFLDKVELEQDLQWSINKTTALFTYHPETLTDNAEEKIKIILQALKQSKLNVIFTYANADKGGSTINKAIERFVIENTRKYHVVKNLGQLRYLSVLNYVDLVIGNSSSGIIEVASFGKPVVNIGNRQSGRLQNDNVINCDVNNILEAINHALSEKFIENCNNNFNIYGDGNTSTKICNALKQVKLSVIKKFIDKGLLM